jgi:hypothetical protein
LPSATPGTAGGVIKSGAGVRQRSSAHSCIPAADEQYNQLDGTYKGRVLNADLAREMSRDYKDLEELHAIQAEIIGSYEADNFNEEAVFQALAEVES